MKRIGLAGLLLLAVAGCNHRQPEPAPSAASEEAADTGMPVYPRAYPVALPVTIATTPPVTSPVAMPASATPAPGGTPAYSAVTNLPAGAGAPVSSPAGEPPASMDASTMPAPGETVPAATGVAPSPVAGGPAVSGQVAVLSTSFGLIVIALDDFAAPKTCENFRRLVSTGFYDGTIFHRVIPEFIIQGGDPNTKGPNRAIYGLGDPGYTLPPEIKLHHDRGAVAMARLPDSVNPQRYSNGSQFYICIAPCPTLDGQYTVFGHVIIGMDVATRIATVPADRRNDPLERIAVKATLETQDQAMREVGAAPGP